MTRVTKKRKTMLGASKAGVKARQQRREAREERKRQEHAPPASPTQEGQGGTRSPKTDTRSI